MKEKSTFCKKFIEFKRAEFQYETSKISIINDNIDLVPWQLFLSSV